MYISLPETIVGDDAAQERPRKNAIARNSQQNKTRKIQINCQINWINFLANATPLELVTSLNGEELIPVQVVGEQCLASSVDDLLFNALFQIR